MAYTFGGATGDDITLTTTGSAGGSAQTVLACGWFYPTTLTATRGYWSCGNTFGAEVDTTTSELRMKTQNATTGGVWTTTGAGITTNKWWFIAWLFSCNNTGPTHAWRVWVGSIDAVPALVTVNNGTAPVGNFTGSTSRTVGNKGTGTLAFQGDIGWMTFINNGQNLPGPFNITSDGVFDVGTEGTTFANWVYPMWTGRMDIEFFMTPIGTGSAPSLCHVPLNGGLNAFNTGIATATTLALTINTAVLTTNRPPTFLRVDSPIVRPRPRQ